MLFEIDPTLKTAKLTVPAALSTLGYQERYDLQEWVLSDASILGEDLFVITDEYSGFDRTRERLDVLAVDRTGKLVVVELKRSAVGTHADLQAIRYAAYCSTLRSQDVAEIHAEFRGRRGEALTAEEAGERIRRFVDNPEFTEFDNRPRIILGAEEFPPEITASAMWLRSCDIDIQCVRLRPYRIGEHLVLEASVLIPLPEAEDFIIRRERKEAEVAEKVRIDNQSLETRALLKGIIQRLAGRPGFPNKAAPRGSALWYKNVGDNCFLGAIRKANDMRIDLYIDEGDHAFNRAVLAALQQQQDSIEKEIGGELIWAATGSSRKASVYELRKNITGEPVDSVAEWAAAKLARFKDVFGERIYEAIQIAKREADSPEESDL